SVAVAVSAAPGTVIVIVSMLGEPARLAVRTRALMVLVAPRRRVATAMAGPAGGMLACAGAGPAQATRTAARAVTPPAVTARGTENPRTPPPTRWGPRLCCALPVLLRTPPQ